MATTAQRLAALEAWKTAHIDGHVLSGHTHPVPAHPHNDLAAATHTHTATDPVPTPVPTPTPDPTPTPTPTPAPSGNAMPTTDLPGWRLVFSDDFNQAIPEGQFPAAVSSRWSAYPYPWRDTSKNVGSPNPGYYQPSIVSWHDSLCDVFIRTVGGQHLVAAFTPKLASGSPYQLYGRYAIRFRADAIVGYKAAWLTWPQSETWPRDGEIDFPEGDFDKTISGYIHRQGATTGSDQDAFTTSARFTDWHTAVTEWKPGSCEFFLDGVSIGKGTSRVPNTPMRWVIQNETQVDNTQPADASQGHVLIDWVAVWQWVGP